MKLIELLLKRFYGIDTQVTIGGRRDEENSNHMDRLSLQE